MSILDVLPPPQPARSCVDSGWLKCRSEKRQPFPSPLSRPPLNPAPSSSFNPAVSPHGCSPSAHALALSYFPKSPVISLTLSFSSSSCQSPLLSTPTSAQRLAVLCEWRNQQGNVHSLYTTQYLFPERIPTSPHDTVS